MHSTARKTPNRLVSLLVLLSHNSTRGSEVDAFVATGTIRGDGRLLHSSCLLCVDAQSPPQLSPLSAKASQDVAADDIASASYRSYCPRCHRPGPTCLCHALPRDGPISLPNIRVLILQHPREARKRKRTSTVPLIGLCLDDVTICVGTAFGCGDGDDGEGQGKSCPEALRDVLDKPEEEVILLYPGDTALPLQERDAALNRASVVEDTPIDERRTTTLVVIDGTWAQTQAIYQQSPTLQRLPQCMFDDDTASLFDSIRQEPASHCTSTLEAISRALRIVAGGSSKEGDDWNNAAFVAADALEDSLRAMVKGQVQYATDASKSRPRTKNNCDDNASTAKGRKAALGRKIRRRRQAQLSLPKPLSEEEIEARRIRFIYVAHLG
mmetsp:Transcript_2108/g.6078  ORF Transcript_2108/g.6078 Transcript_2108/m.6078 type:complete len:382 (-) Transcript_2108:214-1359(-)